MIHLLFIVVSSIYLIFGFRLVLRTMIASFDQPDWEDVIGCSIFAIILCWSWPLVVLGHSLKHGVGKNDPAHFVKIIAGRTPAQKVQDQIEEQREREMANRERHAAIAAQERALQLGPWRDDAA